jgi:uncharacterized small protein (DUF1192 family)
MEEDLPRPKKKTHEIGQDLSLLSVEELKERIEALKAEISRLESSMASKQASRSAADSVFKS